ncbi:MAG: hypothetical protein SV910_02455 [Chloroflexota bacterium]|nr:hypothetical protein [Chloroflexota bacterium]
MAHCSVFMAQHYRACDAGGVAGAIASRGMGYRQGLEATAGRGGEETLDRRRANDDGAGSRACPRPSLPGTKSLVPIKKNQPLSRDFHRRRVN